MNTQLTRSQIGENIWLSQSNENPLEQLSKLTAHELRSEVLPSEEAVGAAMLQELETIARNKDGDIVMILLGGRGAQGLHKLLGERAARGKDELISRLHVFTQDALAPLRMKSSLSFIRDFERLLGDAFFAQVKSFTPMQTEAKELAALETQLSEYVQKLSSFGGADIFFLGHGPEPEDASHLAYIRTGSGATINDAAGMIPISSGILDHHITKFKAGGSTVNIDDEEECRRASHILTLGPAVILQAKRIVQSVVDASTAPAKKRTYRRVLLTELSDNLGERAEQLNLNPGLWVRLHPNFRSLILPDVLN